jgi:predicted RNase H-like HicB family nuclease
MKNEIIFIVEDSLEGGYEARAAGYSIYTQAETLEELKENMREAVAVHFEPDEKPRLIRMHYIKEEIIAA